MIASLDALPNDPATLKAIIRMQQAEAERMAASVRAYEALVQALKLRIAKLNRQKFGPSSEKIEREIDQLQLALEDLEVAMATAETVPAATPEALADRPSRVGAASRGSPRPRRASGSCSTPVGAAPSAAAPCVEWARTWPRSSNSLPHS